MRIESWKTGLVAVLACIALTGCGGDDGDDTGGTGGTAGSAGTNAGTGGTSGTGTGGTSGTGTGGTSGTGTGGTGGGLPMLTCTEELPTTPLSCGTTMCPMPMMPAGIDTCARPCCVADECGTKSTIEGASSECAVPAQPDPRCPDIDFMGMPLEGCCTAENQCGIISALRGNICITESQIVDLPETPQACDAAGGDEDAGTP